MRWPASCPAGHVVPRCVDHYDTFQTICDWAGVTLDDGRAYPGRDFSGLLVYARQRRGMTPASASMATCA